MESRHPGPVHMCALDGGSDSQQSDGRMGCGVSQVDQGKRAIEIELQGLA